MSPRSGFSRRQRRWIIDRDDGVCALCKSSEKLHVHHIIPQRWGRMVLGWTRAQVNAPENGITVCARCHVGPSPHCIHPDIEQARRVYWSDKESYQKVFGDRDEKCRIREPYWNTEFDSYFLIIAAERTRLYSRIRAVSPPWFSRPSEEGM